MPSKNRFFIESQWTHRTVNGFWFWLVFDEWLADCKKGLFQTVVVRPRQTLVRLGEFRKEFMWNAYNKLILLHMISLCSQIIDMV